MIMPWKRGIWGVCALRFPSSSPVPWDEVSCSDMIDNCANGWELFGRKWGKLGNQGNENERIGPVPAN